VTLILDLDLQGGPAKVTFTLAGPPCRCSQDVSAYQHATKFVDRVTASQTRPNSLPRCIRGW